MQAINRILKQKELDLGQKIVLLSLAQDNEPPYRMGASVFSRLEKLIAGTVAGCRISQLSPEENDSDFHALGIEFGNGENLGRLQMVYLDKPVAHYYLIYVEVAPLFRRRGLGTRVLRHFQKFLESQNALGILDNIIPKDDKTYAIYKNNGWQRVDETLGCPGNEKYGDYMFYALPQAGSISHSDLKEIISCLNNQRAVLDAKSNEEMVRKTIAEFKVLYRALAAYFKDDIEQGNPGELARFMFTRFAVKLAQFQRQIEKLVGYTGGESLVQLLEAFDERILKMAALPHYPDRRQEKAVIYEGSKILWSALPDELKADPCSYIDSLANYRRPILTRWLEGAGKKAGHGFIIGEILSLGFDPTRLKEIIILDEPYIFERIQSKFFSELRRKQKILEEIGGKMAGKKVCGAEIAINPALLTIQAKSLIFVLRRRIPAIICEEAIEQLQSKELKGLNEAVKADLLVVKTAKKAAELVRETTGASSHQLEQLAIYVPWKIESNLPLLVVDGKDEYFEKAWIA